MLGSRPIVLVIDDDEESRLLAQQSYLLGKRVLTSTCEDGWEAVLDHAGRLYAVLMNIKDYQRGLAITTLAVKAGAYCIGIMSETVPDVLNRMSLSINGILVRLSNGEEFILPDGKKNWGSLLRSITTEGPMVISVPV